MVKSKRLVFIKALSNYIEILVLDTKIIEKYKYEPHKLLAIGVANMYNVNHRIVQLAINKGVKEENVKAFTEHILHSIVAQIMRAAVENEFGMPLDQINLESLEFKVTEQDVKFLQTIGIKAESLTDDRKQ